MLQCRLESVRLSASHKCWPRHAQHVDGRGDATPDTACAAHHNGVKSKPFIHWPPESLITGSLQQHNRSKQAVWGAGLLPCAEALPPTTPAQQGKQKLLILVRWLLSLATPPAHQLCVMLALCNADIAQAPTASQAHHENRSSLAVLVCIRQPAAVCHAAAQSLPAAICMLPWSKVAVPSQRSLPPTNTRTPRCA